MKAHRLTPLSDVVNVLEESQIQGRLLLRHPPRWGRGHDRSNDQKPSMVLTCSSQKPSPSSSPANSPATRRIVTLFCDPRGVAMGTCYALGPARLADCLEALQVVDEIRSPLFRRFRRD